MKTNILLICIFYNLISPTKSSYEQQLNSNERLNEGVEIKTIGGDDADNIEDGIDDELVIKEMQEDVGEKMPDSKVLSEKAGAPVTVRLKDPQYKLEVEAGDHADMFGTNEHTYVPADYRGYGRRFVLQYPYQEKDFLKNYKSEENELKPVKASPAFVLAVAKESALLEASKPANPTYQRIQKDILRSGNYWDGVWKEDVLDPSKSLRINKDYSKPVKVKVVPGSYLYRLVSETKNISPRLLYIINNKDDK